MHTGGEEKASFLAMISDEPPPERKNEIFKNLCCPSFLSCFASTLLPCAWLGACQIVQEKQELVVLNFGKVAAIVREPGCYCWNPIGNSAVPVSTARVAMNLDNVKVADLKGNPLIVSGVVTYQVANAKKAALDVANASSYILNQGLTVIKKVAALYPYESADGHSLKTEAERVRQQMVKMLQERCDVAGVTIYNFELTDLAYAPEIAQAMLIRQQAEAMVDARKVIVRGAVEIAHGALEELNKKGICMDNDEKARLTTNLLVTICGDQKVQPVVSLSASDTRPQQHQHKHN